MGFVERFTPAEREAIGRAYVDQHVRPARAVAQLAARGELEGADGEPLAPFEVAESSVRTFAAILRRRRRGEVRSDLAAAKPADAIEALYSTAERTQRAATDPDAPQASRDAVVTCTCVWSAHSTRTR